MDHKTLVNSRRSIRGYKPDPIPREEIDEIISLAKRAPSSMNVQAWHVHVLTGEALNEVRRRNMEELLDGQPPQREIFTHGPYEGEHRRRQVDIAKKLFAAMDIAREDKDRRQDWVKRGFRQFDAPVSIILTYDKSLDPGVTCHFDLGALSYGIVLAAWNKGIG